MRTAVYVDGFNLYYGALRDSPYKWLDLRAMLRAVLSPENKVTLIKYFTAKVRGMPADPGVPRRQQTYLNAMTAHDPAIEIIYGRFFEVPSSVTVGAGAQTRVVHGKRNTEKGTDVSLAVHLLNDAWLDRYDVGVVVSNDTDLAEAVRLAKSECGKTIGLIAPLLNRQRDGSPRRMSDALRRCTDFQREIRAAGLAASQLPNPVTAASGTQLAKPPSQRRRSAWPKPGHPKWNKRTAQIEPARSWSPTLCAKGVRSDSGGARARFRRSGVLPLRCHTTRHIVLKRPCL